MSKGKTTWESIGGNNEDQIGGNAKLIVHTNKEGKTSALLIDSGTKMSNKDTTGYDAIIANVAPFLSKHGEPPKIQFDNFKIAVTHGHEDHKGAFVHLARMGYSFPEIVTSPYNKDMIEMGFAKNRMGKSTFPKVTPIENKKKVKVGDIDFELLPASHSIPGASMVHVETPDARLVDAGDFKADQTTPYGEPTDFKYLEELSKKGVDAVFVDSTSCMYEGETPPESGVKDKMIELGKRYKDKRIIFPTIASSMQRFDAALAMAGETGKDIILMGSQNGNWRILNKHFKANSYKGKRVGIYAEKDPKAKFLQKRKTIVIPTGTQAEESAAMARAADDKHPFLYFDPKSDVVIPGQRIIPVEGNKEKVEAMYNMIKAKGVKVLDPVHVSGHGYSQDNKKFLEAVSKHAPQGHKVTFVPIHGDKEQLQINAKIAHECGAKAIVTPNASKLEISKEGCKTVENNKEFTWIGADDKNNDFRKPNYQYYLVNSKYEKVHSNDNYNDQEQDKKPKKHKSKSGKKGGKRNKGGKNKNFAKQARASRGGR